LPHQYQLGAVASSAGTFDAVRDGIAVPARAGCPHRRERKDAIWTERNGGPIMVGSHPAATG